MFIFFPHFCYQMSFLLPKYQSCYSSDGNRNDGKRKDGNRNDGNRNDGPSVKKNITAPFQWHNCAFWHKILWSTCNFLLNNKKDFTHAILVGFRPVTGMTVKMDTTHFVELLDTLLSEGRTHSSSHHLCKLHKGNDIILTPASKWYQGVFSFYSSFSSR